jgi:hypothetical protein
MAFSVDVLGTALGDAAHRHDPPIPHSHIGAEAGPTGSVHDHSITDNQVVAHVRISSPVSAAT